MIAFGLSQTPLLSTCHLSTYFFVSRPGCAWDNRALPMQPHTHTASLLALVDTYPVASNPCATPARTHPPAMTWLVPTRPKHSCASPLTIPHSLTHNPHRRSRGRLLLLVWGSRRRSRRLGSFGLVIACLLQHATCTDIRAQCACLQLEHSPLLYQVKFEYTNPQSSSPSTVTTASLSLPCATARKDFCPCRIFPSHQPLPH